MRCVCLVLDVNKLGILNGFFPILPFFLPQYITGGHLSDVCVCIHWTGTFYIDHFQYLWLSVGVHTVAIQCTMKVFVVRPLCWLLAFCERTSGSVTWNFCSIDMCCLEKCAPTFIGVWLLAQECFCMNYYTQGSIYMETVFFTNRFN